MAYSCFYGTKLIFLTLILLFFATNCIFWHTLHYRHHVFCNTETSSQPLPAEDSRKEETLLRQKLSISNPIKADPMPGNPNKKDEAEEDLWNRPF